ncbi:MAG: 2-hydroxyacyl-CoA dehydratase [Clostridium sp.]|nr:2-hydroxyacyl-CoA dehydratase [Clostridium sp.]MCM1444104.1 2-hydroxyacyl-CoA dehydratase [Candidatus Amulumruptor caecigallinarius]
MNTKKICFPHMGNYYIPANYFFSHCLHAEVLKSPKITSKTIELGTKYSPSFVCTPFKYTIGTLIEGLENGANILLQMGGGCRYGYYSELQEEILKGLGYKFTYINFVTGGRTDLKKIYKSLKKVDKKFNIIKAIYYLFITVKMIKYMDIVDNYIRKNIGFEVNKGNFERLNKEMLSKFSNVKSYRSLRKIYKKYFKLIKSIKVDKKDVLRVGVIGELYTVMEPFANYFLEKELATFGIEITRFTNAHYLLFEKSKCEKKYLKKAKDFIKYKMGADAHDNIARAKELCGKGIDGIIHIKSSFCTPEIGAMSIIEKVCNKYDVPVIFFSFDSNTSEVGIKTRLEAFYEMIEMRKRDEKLFRD